FATYTSGRQGKEKIISLYPIADTSIERHIKVRGNASPDDPSLKEYWEKRHQKQGQSNWEKNSKYYLVAQAQNWKCPMCGEPLFNDEELETHYSALLSL
ncbi:MAG TPA: group II intron reverse transcriptase/maturase, partial [Phormidium sp.]